MSWRASRASEILNEVNSHNHYGESTCLELLRRAALLADAEGDAATAEEARLLIVNSHLESNSNVDLIVAFTWLLHNTPDADEDLLWIYKWVVSVMGDIVSISTELIEDAILDLERRYAIAGLSTAPAAQLRLSTAMTMSQYDLLPGLFRAWQRDESGVGSDCTACRRNQRVDYYEMIGDDERAVTEAKPLINGSMTCAEIPRDTYPTLLLPLWRLGRIKEAEDMFRRGKILLGDSERTPRGLDRYLIYLALRGRFDAGCSLVTTWMRRVFLSRNDGRRFDFLRGASLLFRSAMARGEGVVHLSLPPVWSGFEKDGLYEVERLSEQFDSDAKNLAALFDARHGNTGYSDDLRQDKEMLEQALSDRGA